MGVALKTEADGRMFPTTDSSQTIVDCLRKAAAEAGVRVEMGTRARCVRVCVCVCGRGGVVSNVDRLDELTHPHSPD